MSRPYRITTTPESEAEQLWRELNGLRRRAATAQDWAQLGVLVQVAGIAFQRALLWRMGSLEGAVRALREEPHEEPWSDEERLCREAEEVIG